MMRSANTEQCHKDRKNSQRCEKGKPSSFFTSDFSPLMYFVHLISY